MTATTTDPVGLAEIAERLGVKRQTANQWHFRKVLPETSWRVSGQPCWGWEQIERWAKETGRL